MPRSANPHASAAEPTATPRSEPTPREPLYRQVVTHLRNDISRGVFPVGTQLPTEDELAKRFSVSRHTIREALRQLRSDGLVSSRQGSGTTVMPPLSDTPFNVHRVASIDELIAYAVDSRYTVQKSALLSGREVTIDEADIAPDSQWLQLQGVRHRDSNRDDHPVCWTEVLIASEYAGVERLLERQRGPIWQLIENMYGERLTEVEQMLRVRSVPPEVADDLRIDADAMVVEIRRTYKTSQDKVAEISVNLYPADTFRFNMKLRRA